MVDVWETRGTSVVSNRFNARLELLEKTTTFESSQFEQTILSRPR